MVLQLAEHFPGGWDAEIGGEQRHFQIVQHRAVNLGLALHRLFDSLHQLGFGGSDSLLQSIEESGLFLFNATIITQVTRLVFKAMAESHVLSLKH